MIATRRLAAILAADVAGYSRMMGADEEGTLERLKALRRELIDPKIAEHRGRIVKTTGDGMLVEFPSVVDAVRCAVAVQQAMPERNTDVAADNRIELRIGINLGDVIVEGDDLYGDGVNCPARLVERFGAASMPSDHVPKLLNRAARLAAALGGSPDERAKLVRELVEKVIVDEKTIIIKLQRGAPLGGDIPLSASADGGDNAIELTAAVAFRRHGAETKLVLLGLAQQKHNSRCDPALIKAIARGRAWFEELATGHARSLQELAKRDGISRRYIRRLVGLAFLSPQLVEAILQGRQSVELTATRLTELDLPLDWTEQHKLLAS